MDEKITNLIILKLKNANFITQKLYLNKQYRYSYNSSI